MKQVCNILQVKSEIILWSSIQWKIGMHFIFVCQFIEVDKNKSTMQMLN